MGTERPPLEVSEADEYGITLVQPEFSDAWAFRMKWDGCVDFGQYEDREADKMQGWEHVCDLDLLIDYLIEARDRAREHFKDNEGAKMTGAWHDDN